MIEHELQRAQGKLGSLSIFLILLLSQEPDMQLIDR